MARVHLLMHKDRPVARFALEYSRSHYESNLLQVLDPVFCPKVISQSKVKYLSGLDVFFTGRSQNLGRMNLDFVYHYHGFEYPVWWFLLFTNRCVSLTDCYWTKEEGEAITWAEVSPYRHGPNPLVADQFFWERTQGRPVGLSPDFTLRGASPKFWFRDDQGVHLIKGATSWGELCPGKLFMDLLVGRLARRLGVDHVEQVMLSYQGRLVLKSKNFTSEAVSYRPAFMDLACLGQKKGREAFLDLYQANERVLRGYQDMLVLDFIVGNESRGSDKFGLLVDNDTNQALSLAPLFGFGEALYHFNAIEAYLEDPSQVTQRANEVKPFMQEKRYKYFENLYEDVEGLLGYEYDQLKKWNIDFYVSKACLELIIRGVKHRLRLLID